MSEKKHILHLFSRRERWGLTWQGALLILGLMILFIALILRNLYPMRGPTQREKADILVLEGFISDYVLQ